MVRMDSMVVDSHRPEDSVIADVMLTPTQARERGIPWSSEPPPPVKCEYCGKVMERTGICIAGKIIIWQPEYIPLRCDCDQAKAHWAEVDARERREQLEREEAERRELFKQRCNRLLSDSGIKKRYLNKTFGCYECNTPEKHRALEIAKDYVVNFQKYREGGNGLYFEGTNGTGKTHLAAAITLNLIAKGIPVIFKTGEQLLSDIKRAYDIPDVREHEVFDVYIKADLLVIDDLGKEQCTEWAMTAIYKIINARYEDMRPTIVTTNFNTDMLVRKLTPPGGDGTKIYAVISRLKEVSSVITMAWEDYRQRGGTA